MTYEDLQQQELHEKVDSTEKKLNDLQKEVTDLSIISKLRKKKDIENELNAVKTDLKELKKNTNLSDTDKEKITKMEIMNTELLASIQTELFDLKGDIENQGQDATRRQKNKTNVLIGAGTLGIGLLIMRWRKKRQEKKAAENPDAPPKKGWFLGALGTAAIGIGTFFGIKAIVGPEKWGQFKNWLGFKDKEGDDEEEAETETINENLTAEEIHKRNEYIEKSIKESTTMPITIDYGPDKDLLEKKGCPKTISFDSNNQNILLGQNNKINIKTKPFTLGGKSITSSRFQTIQPVANGFEVTMQTGYTQGLRPVIQMQKVTISKEEFIAMLSPYYTQQTQEYNVNISNGGETIPLHISTSREIQSQVGEDVDAVFESLNTFKKNQYTKFGTSINGYYKNLHSMNSEYGQQSDLLGAGAEDDEKFEQNVGAIPAMMDEKFDNVGDIIKDTMLERVKNIGDITTEKIASFLDKYKDNQIFGKVMGKISGFLSDLFSRGGTIDMAKLEEVFQSDPGMKQKVSLLMWKMSKIKGYLTDQQEMILKKIKSENPSRTESQQKDELKRIYLDLKIVGENASSASALKTLETYDLLNRINENREFTVKAQKIAKELQNEIEATNSDRGSDITKDRGDIIYDPNTQRLRSRGLSTEIEIIERGEEEVGIVSRYLPKLPGSNNNLYKLKNGDIGLDIEFTSIRELLWTANFLNWVDYTYKKTMVKNRIDSGSNLLLPMFLEKNSPKFEFINTNISLSDGVEASTGINVESDISSLTVGENVISKDDIEKNASTLLYGNSTWEKGDNIKTFTGYMNARMKHYDIGDDFWYKAKSMGGKIAEGINAMIESVRE